MRYLLALSVGALVFGTGLVASTAVAHADIYVVAFNRMSDGASEIHLNALEDEEMRIRMFAGRQRQTGAGTTTPRLIFKSLNKPFELRDIRLFPKADCDYGRTTGRRVRDNRSIVICYGDFVQVQVEASESEDEICVIEPEKVPFDVFIDAHGHDGDDALAGGSHYDELNGEDGYDVLIGRGGNDHLSGFRFAADDQLYSDPDDGSPPMNPPTSDRDDDYLYGGPGSDGIWGGPGQDVIVGGPGADYTLCGSDAAGWDEALSPTAYGCEDRWDRDDGGNSIFSSEPRDLNPETGRPAPAASERDEVDCGGSASSTPNFVQYDAGLDFINRCPTEAAPQTTPPQIADPHPVPSQLGPRARCPRLRAS